MQPQRAYGARPGWPMLPRMAIVAASSLAGLLACPALLIALVGPVPSALDAPASGPVNYPGGAGCTTTLQACVDNSPTGTTIAVQAGTYFTNGLTLNKAVSLTGQLSSTTILHALANQRVLTVTGAAVNSSVMIGPGSARQWLRYRFRRICCGSAQSVSAGGIAPVTRAPGIRVGD